MAAPPRRLALFALLLAAPAACDPAPSAKPAKPTATALPTVAPTVTPPKPLATSSGTAPTFAPAPEKKPVKGAPLQVKFGFAPPLDKPFVVERVRKKRKGRGPKTGQEEILGTKKRVVVTKRGEELAWTITPLSFTHHGHRNSRIDELAESFPTTVRLDPNGGLLGIEGYDDVLKRARTKLSVRTFKAMGKMLEPDTLRRTQLQDWKSRVGDLVGKTLTIGKAVVSTSEVPLAKGSAKTYVVTRVTTWTECALGSCVEVESAYDTNRKALEKRTGVTIPEAKEPEDHAGHDHGKGDHGKGDHGKGDHAGHGHGAKKGPKGPPIGHAGLTIRVIDPVTSMPVWERVERVVDLAGMASLEDEMVLRYDYAP